MHATRTTTDTTLGGTIGDITFTRDMFFDIPLVDYWQAIHKHCKHYVNENLRHANLKQRQYDFAQGQKFLKKVHDPNKLVVRTSGPYTIEKIHVNGIITI